ncbi:MAG TPA: nitroreductase family deazaflavin-dependent oxidoreductase [Candidatus Binataceae bacterium]|nr:nitroreductase family deazaflavin-dependent oxidoreductase [Candidatus Binataceae bacterium]
MAEHFIHETALDRFFNRLMGALVRVGVAPGYMRRLEVRGRKTGKIYGTPVNLLESAGSLYLVAARGETAWARNARAAGRVTLRRGGRAPTFRVRELVLEEKPLILKQFLDKFASQVQRFFPVPAGAPIEAFRDCAANIPAFELIKEGISA